MTETLRTSAEEWATQALKTIGVEGLAQIDLDGLVQVDTPETALDLGLEAFSVARELANGAGMSLGTVLVLPLPPSAGLEIRPVLVQEWPSSVELRFSMPGLYILRPAALFEWDEIEEYRTPTQHADDRIVGARVYFRTFRSRSEARRGWEYTRAVYIVDVTSVGTS